MRLGHDEALWLLWLLPIAGLLYVWAFYRKSVLLRRFAEQPLLVRLAGQVSRSRQITKAVIVVLALGAMVFALTQPAWSPTAETVHHRGRDIIVLLDVSRSMLAEDIKPNRLQRAKLAISDLMNELVGDRIGIIAFAGQSVTVCPLTHDYGFARMALSDVSVDTVPRGGSLIGDAIRKALDEVLDEQERDYKDIILITDGEDHESFPVDAAHRAAQLGVRVFCIGLGDEDQGTPIPVVDESGQKTFLSYEGETVMSQLDSQLLRDIVYATPGGKYLNVATGTFDLAEIYRSLIRGADQRELEATTRLRYQEKFQVFVVLALVLLVCEAWIGERKKV